MVLDSKSTRRTKPAAGTTRNLTLPKSFIYDNGTEQSTAFNDVTWSTATTKYMTFVNTSLRLSSFEKIVEKAQKMVVSTGRLQTSDSTDVDNYSNVQLVDLSDDECKPFYFNFFCMQLAESLIEFWDLSYMIAAHTRIAAILQSLFPLRVVISPSLSYCLTAILFFQGQLLYRIQLPAIFWLCLPSVHYAIVGVRKCRVV